MLPTQSIRNEHAELIPHLEELLDLADDIGEITGEVLNKELDACLDFLTGHLVPHAEAEDAVLYPAVAELLGSPRAVETMRREHAEIAHMARELRAVRNSLGRRGIRPGHERKLRELLFGLHAVVRLHFVKEEEVYLPLLDAELTADEVSELHDRMREHARHEHGSLQTG